MHAIETTKNMFPSFQQIIITYVGETWLDVVEVELKF